jgi:hypothetical protein
VGSSRIVELRNAGGEPNGFSLELRRLLDGMLAIRIFEPGQRAGIAMPGGASLAQIAGALIKSVELRVPTRVGFYSFLRERDTVTVGYYCFEDDAERRWLASVNDVLLALREVTRYVA